MQPILSITVPVKKIKGAARQCYIDSDAQCEQAFTVNVKKRYVGGHMGMQAIPPVKKVLPVNVTLWRSVWTGL